MQDKRSEIFQVGMRNGAATYNQGVRGIPESLMARLEQRAKEASAVMARRSEKELQPKAMFLPGFRIGAMPNHLNRSSLFAPIARGRRKFHQRTVMVTRSDCILEYTGEQLDEADSDIIMALIFFAYPYPLERLVPLNRAELLRKIGRCTGQHDYAWLRRRLQAIAKATIVLQATRPDGTVRYGIGLPEAMPLVGKFTYDGTAGTYSYRLDRRWDLMFSNREYGLLDWNKRLQLGRGQDMAKALQRLVATSSDKVQRYALDNLKDKMGYTGRLRDFQISLKRSVRELERVEIIVRGDIENSTRGKTQLVLYVSEASGSSEAAVGTATL